MKCENEHSVISSSLGATLLAHIIGFSDVGSFILGIAIGFYFYRDFKNKEKLENLKEKEEYVSDN